MKTLEQYKTAYLNASTMKAKIRVTTEVVVAGTSEILEEFLRWKYEEAGKNYKLK